MDNSYNDPRETCPACGGSGISHGPHGPQICKVCHRKRIYHPPTRWQYRNSQDSVVKMNITDQLHAALLKNLEDFFGPMFRHRALLLVEKKEISPNLYSIRVNMGRFVSYYTDIVIGKDDNIDHIAKHETRRIVITIKPLMLSAISDLSELLRWAERKH